MVICEWEKDVAGFGGCLGFVVVVFCSLSTFQDCWSFFLTCVSKFKGIFVVEFLNRKKMMFYWIIFFFLVFFFFFCLHELFLSRYKHRCPISKKKKKKQLCNFSHNYILWNMDDMHIIAQHHQHNVNLIKRHKTFC